VLPRSPANNNLLFRDTRRDGAIDDQCGIHERVNLRLTTEKPITGAYPGTTPFGRPVLVRQGAFQRVDAKSLRMAVVRKSQSRDPKGSGTWPKIRISRENREKYMQPGRRDVLFCASLSCDEQRESNAGWYQAGISAARKHLPEAA
jgi:hypothetical protein